MYFKLNRFVLDEKDLFLILFGVFLVASAYASISVLPFRFDSLVVLFLFLLVSRITNTYFGTLSFFFAVISALWFSLFLSPYTLAIYLGAYLLILKKINKI